MRRIGFVLLPILVIVLVGIVGLIAIQSIRTRDNSEKSIFSSVVLDTNLKRVSPTTAGDQKGMIEGKITLNYKIPEFPKVNDDINVLVSEKGENETNYFSAVNCEQNRDNCVWLISEIGSQRIYGYRLTFEGGADILRVGEKYKVYVSIGHNNDGGNVTFTESNKVSVKIPSSGIQIQNFDLTVNPL